MGCTRLLLAFMLLAYVLLVARAQAESHHKEHYKPDKHLLREKKAKEHHAYLHNDKQTNKQVRKSFKFEGPHHEEKMQRDVAEPRERPSDAWHRKDMHLQDLSYDVQKEHRSSHSQHHSKPHHSWSHHNGKHTTDHHKAKESSSEHGFLHKPHKATPSTFEEKHHALSKSLQHSPKERSHHKEESHQFHLLTNKKAKPSSKDHFWSKNKKQKDKKVTHDKKQKPKQHRKKLSRGELHKLW